MNSLGALKNKSLALGNLTNETVKTNTFFKHAPSRAQLFGQILWQKCFSGAKFKTFYFNNA